MIRNLAHTGSSSNVRPLDMAKLKDFVYVPPYSNAHLMTMQAQWYSAAL